MHYYKPSSSVLVLQLIRPVLVGVVQSSAGLYMKSSCTNSNDILQLKALKF